jgi:hypothetical protein
MVKVVQGLLQGILQAGMIKINWFLIHQLKRFKMSIENELAVFSVRIPKKLAEQIDGRAKVNRRTRNAEIVLLLEQIIDIHVARDLKAQEEHRKATAGLTTITS